MPYPPGTIVYVATSEPKTPSDYLREAEEAIKAKRYREALEGLDELLRLPDLRVKPKVEANHLRALALLESQGDPQQGLQACEQVYALKKDYTQIDEVRRIEAPLRMALAEKSKAPADFLKAAEAYEGVAKLFKDAKEQRPYLFNQAAALTRANAPSKAKPLLERVVQVEARDALAVDAFALLAVDELQQKNFVTALKHLQAFFNAVPKDHPALAGHRYYHAFALWHNKQGDQAVTALEHYLRAYPTDKHRVEALLLGIDWYNERQQATKAETLLVELGKLSPKDHSTAKQAIAFAYLKRAQEADERKDMPSAVQHFEAALKFLTEDAKEQREYVLAKLGFLLLNTDAEKGRSTLSKQIRDYPQGTYANQSRMILAESYARAGNSGDAIEVYQDVVKSNTKSADRALFAIAHLYEQQKSVVAAREHYERLLSDFPASDHIPAAHTALARIAKEANELATAAAHWKALVARGKQCVYEAQAAFELASLLEKDFKLREAAKAYTAVGEYPHKEIAIAALERAILLYLQTGLKAEADTATKRLNEVKK